MTRFVWKVGACMKIDAAHVRRWISTHETARLDASVSAAFDQYLCGYPWLPSRLDWSQIPFVEFTMEDSWEDRIVEFAAQTPVGRHSHLMIMFDYDEPSLLTLKDDGLRDLDLLYSGSPGARYFCGADIIEGRCVPCHEDFAEFDGWATVTFRG